MQAVLRNNEHAPGLGQLDGGAQARNASAYHQKISFQCLGERQITTWYNGCMPTFAVRTAQCTYPAIVERGSLGTLTEHLPPGSGKLFVVTTGDVWNLHGSRIAGGLREREHHVLFLPGGEVNKRFAEVEKLAEQMVLRGADRSSIVIGFGGGIVTDMAGFLAAIFMRGIPVIQVPTTLLGQVDAAIGGKTGVNLAAGKNLIGSFHQPLAVLIDPGVLDTLPEREYRAGLFEIVKYGVIADADLFWLLRREPGSVLAHAPAIVDRIIADSVRIKADVVSADEKESDLRRILNFGHTFGHALEAETGYTRFLHGEAVGFGMKAAISLAASARLVERSEADEMLACIDAYGPLPAHAGVNPERIVARLKSDKKTVQGRIYFVLPETIGRVRITSEVDTAQVLRAIESALAA